MDLLAEEIESAPEALQIIPQNDLKIGTLLWVDDVVSMAEGRRNQIEMLKRVDEFACRHKLQWGRDKCKVIKVGKVKDKTKNWKLGPITIQTAES